MTPRRLDLTGHKYNRLTVLGYSHVNKRGGSVWKCICECGNQLQASSDHLRRGNVKSCGCLNSEAASSRMKKLHEDGRTYNGSGILRREIHRIPNDLGVCWASDCDREIGLMSSARGVCAKCRSALRRRGQIEGFPRLSINERFLALSTKGSAEECHEWKYSRDIEGYGRFSYNGKQVKAHRFALELKLGRPLDEDMFACHTCDNPPCVNPDHLFEGSAKDNVEDMLSKGRGRWQKEVV